MNRCLMTPQLLGTTISQGHQDKKECSQIGDLRETNPTAHYTLFKHSDPIQL